MSGRARAERTRRGAVLPATLAFVAIATVVGLAVISRAGSSGAETDAWLARGQALVAARSRVDAVAIELGQQRRDLLSGATPELVEAVTLATDAAGSVERAWVVRLVAWEDEGRTLARSEAIVLPPAGSSDERSLVDAVSEGLDAVAGVGGVDLIPRSDRSRSDGDDLGDELGDDRAARGLDRVFASDPEIQGGVGSGASAGGGGTGGDPSRRRGRERVQAADLIALGGRSRSSIEEAAPEGLPTGLATRLIGEDVAGRLASAGAFVGFLYGDNGPESEDERAAAFDAVAFSTEPRVRVDLNRAPEEVLDDLFARAGASERYGASIVEARADRDERERASPLWVVEAGIVPAEVFAAVASSVSARSLQWRVRVEAGLRVEEVSSGDEFGVLEGRSALEYPVTLEAVIDVSGEPARVVRLVEVRGVEVRGVEVGS